MRDDAIVSLYWQRDESAISETQQKYGNYLSKIAFNVLSDSEDAEECVNDTYLRAWNSIPPHKPAVLSTYLGKIVRQAAIDIYRKRSSAKRQGSEYTLSLSELGECVSNGDVTQRAADAHLLADAIGAFLRTLPTEARGAFICRYYFLDSIREIADYYGASQSKIKSLLHRTRIALKNYLLQEGFEL